jgi:YesN/AraC family two-component response regulator
MGDLKQLKIDADGVNILCVEDNEKLRETVQTLLKKIFSNVLVASDGVEGLVVFKENFPHIVITDINMPKMNGLEMAAAIHEISPKTKIIVMSAFDEKDNLFKAIEFGAFRFLKKPVNSTELTDVLSLSVKAIHEEEKAQEHARAIFLP